MTRGKREVSKIYKSSLNNSSHKIQLKKVLIIIVFIVLVLGIFIYFFPKLKFSKEVSNNDTKSSNIETVKTISGMENVEISGISIESNTSNSIFNIKIINKSNDIILPCKVHFYAIDSNQNVIFGAPVNLPELSINTPTQVKVFCSKDISSAVDYNIIKED